MIDVYLSKRNFRQGRFQADYLDHRLETSWLSPEVSRVFDESRTFRRKACILTINLLFYPPNLWSTCSLLVVILVNVCCHSCFLPFVNYRADIDEFQAYNSVPNLLLNFPLVIFQNLKDFLLLCPSAFIAMSASKFWHLIDYYLNEFRVPFLSRGFCHARDKLQFQRELINIYMLEDRPRSTGVF